MQGKLHVYLHGSIWLTDKMLIRKKVVNLVNRCSTNLYFDLTTCPEYARGLNRKQESNLCRPDYTIHQHVPTNSYQLNIGGILNSHMAQYSNCLQIKLAFCGQINISIMSALLNCEQCSDKCCSSQFYRVATSQLLSLKVSRSTEMSNNGKKVLNYLQFHFKLPGFPVIF